MYKTRGIKQEKIVELQENCKKLDLKKIKVNKEQLTYAILDKQAESLSLEKNNKDKPIKKQKIIKPALQKEKAEPIKASLKDKEQSSLTKQSSQNSKIRLFDGIIGSRIH